MALVPEIAFAQLAKQGEELCGDKVEVSCTPLNSVVVLSDGLGSGVKANILATLTAKIAAIMVRQNVPVKEVVTTLIQTLPTCKVRDLAYSTFTILNIDDIGWVQLFEYDAPPVLKIRKDEVEPIKTVSRQIFNKTIGEANFRLEEGDILVIVSDGVIQAGLGGIMPLGLGLDGLIKNIKKNIDLQGSAQDIANQILELCQAYYALEIGDDSTAVVIKYRRSRQAVVLTGPPADSTLDSQVVQKFMKHKGKKIVCGGTTANIVARETGRPLMVDFDYVDPQVPPIAKIKGIDLVTEGILTLTKGLELVIKNSNIPSNSLDGSSLLAKELLQCDQVCFMVGLRVNPAHQNPDLPLPLGLRKSIVERWKKHLEGLGKVVQIEWY